MNRFFFILNLFWILSVILLIFGLRITLPRLYLSNHVDSFIIGKMKVKSKNWTRHKNASNGIFSMKAEIEKSEKFLVFSDQPGIRGEKYTEGSFHDIWYHKDFKRAFFISNNNTEKFVLPDKYLNDTYLSIVFLIVPFIILSIIKLILKLNLVWPKDAASST